MSFVRLLFTASKLNKLKTQLVEEKTDAIKVSKHLKTKRRFRHIGIDCRRKIKQFFQGLCKLPENSCLHKTCYNLRHEGSCENFTLKSFLGFFGGVLLTYLFFIFLVFSLNVKLTTATIFCSLLGCILTNGLAFSTSVRCVVLLTLPQFFAKRGRQALLAYVFILVISGPAKNTLNNLGILSESLACGQEQLKQAVRQIIDVIKKPFLAIRDAIKKVVKVVKEVIKKIKEILLTIKRIIMAIVRVVKAAFEFLGKIINICNKELGTPFERCTRVFENAIIDCHAKLGPIFSWLCSITYIVKSVCYIVKIFDFVCMIVDFISDSVVGVVIRKVKIFIRHIRTMFYVRIKFSHSYEFNTNSSKTLSQISKEITAEIRDRTKTLRKVFDFMTSASTVFFLFMIVQVTYYRYKFLTSERFDNIYITKDFRNIDLRRAKLEKETVLPLNHREEQIYIQTASGKLVASEKKSLAKSAVSLASASVKIAAHLAADYCLFWILNLINHYGRFQSKVQGPNMPTAHVSGNGFLADLLRAIVKAFQPVGIQLEIDTIPCLPIPIPPNYDRYIQIGVTLLICWIFTLFEPYGLRLRHKVMAYYHPHRSKERTIWLYNHIMRSRNSFLKFARRQLRRKVFGTKGIEKITCKEYLRANLRCKIFRLCLGDDLQTACMLCGEVFRESDAKKPIRCHTPDCPGVYCERCFADLQNMCTVCLSPIEYGDMSDIDEEKDSSEEESKDDQKKKKETKSSDKDSKSTSPEDDDQDDDTSKPALAISNATEPETDSDYESSASTDYSYSYQYSHEDLQTIESSNSFKDVEKQEIPDYACMESFKEPPMHDILSLRELESDSSIDYEKYTEPPLIELDVEMRGFKQSKGTSTDFKISVGTEMSHTRLTQALDRCSDLAITASVQTDRVCKKANPTRRSIPSTVIEFFGIPSRGQNKKQKQLEEGEQEEEEFPLLEQSCDCGVEDSKNPFISNKHVEFVGVPNVEPPQSTKSASSLGLQSETTFITLPRSTMSTNTTQEYCGFHLDNVPTNINDTSSSLHTETVEELANKGSAIPKLNLSPLDEPSSSKRKDLSDMFNYVKCEEISETQRSSLTPTSLVSSSVISSLEDDNRKEDTTAGGSDTRRVSFRNQNPFESDSTSSTNDWLTVESQQKQKVRDYYKATNQVDHPKMAKKKPKKKKKNKIITFFKNLFVERKRGSTDLPLLQENDSDTEEVVEVKSYNYVQDQWDTFSVTTDSPTYPFEQAPNVPSTQNSENTEAPSDLNRIRGGECGNINLEGYSPRLHLGRRPTHSYFPLPPIAENTTHDWLQKYFISLDDLTPTKDPGLQMQQNSTVLESIPISNTSQETTPQDLPERDRSDVQLRHTEKSSHLDIDAVPSSASSVLSESVCAAILGKPCPGRLKNRKNKRGSSTTTTTAATESASGDLGETSKEHSVDSEQSQQQQQLQLQKSSIDSPGQPAKGILRKASQQQSNNFGESSQNSDSPDIVLNINQNNRSDPSASSAEPNLSNTIPKQVKSSDIPTAAEITSQAIPDSTLSQPKRLSQEIVPQHFPTSAPIGQLNISQNQQEPVTSDSTPTQEVVVVKHGAKQLLQGSSPLLKVQLSFNSCPNNEDMSESFCNCQNKSDERICQQRSADKTVVTRESFPLRQSWSQSSGRINERRTLLTSDKIQQTSDNDFYHSGNNTVSFTTDPLTMSTVSMRRSSTLDQTQPTTSTANQVCKCPFSEETTSASRTCTFSCCKCPQPTTTSDFSRGRSDYSDYISEPQSSRAAYERPPLPRVDYGDYYPYESRPVPPPMYRDFQDIPQPPPPRQTPPRRMSSPPRHQQRRRTGNNRIPKRETCTCNGECYCCNHYSPRDAPGRPPRRSYPEYTTSYATNEDEEDFSYSNPNQIDLPYQNNEEYMELVQELEETLHSRNRNRVRRAMEEFENRSRHNRPLDKPIIDYDQTSESEEPIIQKINKLRTEKRMCCAGDQCSCRHKERPEPKRQSPRKKTIPTRPPESSGCCHWQMDPYSGEWIKVSSTHGVRYRGKSPAVHDCNCECKYCYS